MTIPLEELEKVGKAVERLEVPGQHCVGALARNRGGEPVIEDSDTAAQWCAIGALNKEKVSIPTQQALAKSINKSTFENAWSMGHVAEGYPIFMLNDRTGEIYPDGRESIRAEMKQFVLDNLPKPEEKTEIVKEKEPVYV